MTTYKKFEYTIGDTNLRDIIIKIKDIFGGKKAKDILADAATVCLLQNFPEFLPLEKIDISENIHKVGILFDISIYREIIAHQNYIILAYDE